MVVLKEGTQTILELKKFLQIFQGHKFSLNINKCCINV